MATTLAQAESGLSADIDAVRLERGVPAPRALTGRGVAQMFSQGTQRVPAAPAAGAQPAALSQNGTLDESVTDTLKRDAFRCAAAHRCSRGARGEALTDSTSTRRVARNVKAVLLPGLKGTAGAQVRVAAARLPAARCDREEAAHTACAALKPSPPRARRRRCGTGTSGGRSYSP